MTRNLWRLFFTNVLLCKAEFQVFTVITSEMLINAIGIRLVFKCTRKSVRRIDRLSRENGPFETVATIHGNC